MQMDAQNRVWRDMGLSSEEIEERKRLIANGGKGHPGNADCYDANKVALRRDSPLKGKTILFLGSSVTAGTFALGQSFVEFLEARDGIVAVKDAIAGTTLVDIAHDGSSYVERLMRIDQAMIIDALVCQLSTNDALSGRDFGSEPKLGYDVRTIAGAISFIVDYSRATWGCPVLFFTSAPFENAAYAAEVEMLKRVADQTEMTIVDLFNDSDLKIMSDEERSLCFYDSIHPTKAGYSQLFAPRIEGALEDELCGGRCG